MKIWIDVNDFSGWVQAQKLGGHLWVHLNGRTLQIENPQLRRKSKKSKDEGSGELLAPMPGKITKMMVDKNQLIKKGQTVLVMEAMKMEYTLKAGMDGTVSEVFCSVGDQVSQGKKLAEIRK